MEDAPLLGRDDEHQIWSKIVGRFDAPAYIRRARKVELAHQALLQRCEAQRGEWLQPARILLGILHAQAGSWDNLRPIVCETDLDVLREMDTVLQPKLRSVIALSRSARVLRRALRELSEAMERFNARWIDYINRADLTHINQLRDGYNRYYILEKECYVRSSLIARKGFRPLSPMKKEELLAQFPTLPVIRFS